MVVSIVMWFYVGQLIVLLLKADTKAQSQTRTRGCRKQAGETVDGMWEVFCETPYMINLLFCGEGNRWFSAKSWRCPAFLPKHFTSAMREDWREFLREVGEFMKGQGNFYKNAPPQKCGEWAGAFAQRPPDYCGDIFFEKRPKLERKRWATRVFTVSFVASDSDLNSCSFCDYLKSVMECRKAVDETRSETPVPNKMLTNPALGDAT